MEEIAFEIFEHHETDWDWTGGIRGCVYASNLRQVDEAPILSGTRMPSLMLVLNVFLARHVVTIL